MKRTKYLILSLLLGCGMTLNSCSTMSLQGSSSFMKIKNGMTQEEVVEILGKPTHHRFNGGYEQWEYRKENPFSGKRTVVIVDFINGKVSALNTFDADEAKHLNH